MSAHTRRARRRALAGAGALAAAIVLGGCASGATGETGEIGETEATFVAEQLSWRAEREVALTNPDGYLALVGLLWIDAGRSTFGSAQDADLRLDAAYAPAQLGVLEVTDGRVVFEPGRDVVVTLDGRLGASMSSAEMSQPIEMVTDAAGTPTRLHVGQLVFWIVDRGGRLAVRARHPDSAVLLGYGGTDAYAPAPEWRIDATWVPYASPHQLMQPNILGSSYADTAPGELHFELEGVPYVLEPIGADAESLFLIFGDETNGEHTYGGGRFLALPAPDEDGLVVIDFNRAFNPPCAYSPYTTCPLPLPRNRLPVSVTAGERLPE